MASQPKYTGHTAVVGSIYTYFASVYNNYKILQHRASEGDYIGGFVLCILIEPVSVLHIDIHLNICI